MGTKPLRFPRHPVDPYRRRGAASRRWSRQRVTLQRAPLQTIRCHRLRRLRPNVRNRLAGSPRPWRFLSPRSAPPPTGFKRQARSDPLRPARKHTHMEAARTFRCSLLTTGSARSRGCAAIVLPLLRQEATSTAPLSHPRARWEAHSAHRARKDPKALAAALTSRPRGRPPGRRARACVRASELPSSANPMPVPFIGAYGRAVRPPSKASRGPAPYASPSISTAADPCAMHAPRALRRSLRNALKRRSRRCAWRPRAHPRSSSSRFTG
jgi:hypothetical protein